MGCTRSVPLREESPAMGTGAGGNIRQWQQLPGIPWCFKDCVVDEFVRDTANDAWDAAMSGNSEAFVAARLKQADLTPLVFFYNTFFDGLFNLMPQLRGQFKGGMAARGKMMSHVIKFLVTSRETGENFDRTLKRMAVDHNKRKIKFIQYSHLGLVFLHSIKAVIGDSAYTPEVKYAFTVKYSRMMQVMTEVVQKNTLAYDSTMTPLPAASTTAATSSQAPRAPHLAAAPTEPGRRSSLSTIDEISATSSTRDSTHHDRPALYSPTSKFGSKLSVDSNGNAVPAKKVIGSRSNSSSASSARGSQSLSSAPSQTVTPAPSHTAAGSATVPSAILGESTVDSELLQPSSSPQNTARPGSLQLPASARGVSSSGEDGAPAAGSSELDQDAKSETRTEPTQAPSCKSACDQKTLFEDAVKPENMCFEI